MDDTLAKRPQIVQQRGSIAHSQKAVSLTSSRFGNEYESDSADASSLYTLSRPAIYDISEIPDTNLYGPHGPYSDYKISHITSEKCTDTPNGFFLPPTVPLSPLPSFRGVSDSSFRSNTPPDLSGFSGSPISDKPATPIDRPASPLLKYHEDVEHRDEQYNPDTLWPPKNIGWDEFRSPRESLDLKADMKIQTHNLWPTKDMVKDKQVSSQPVSLTKLRQEVGTSNKATRVQPPSIQKPASPAGSKNAQSTRKQSDIDTLMTVCNFGKKLKVVYAQGPQGEGQKFWKDIQITRYGNRELKRIQAKVARSKAQEEQINALHAAALDLPVPQPPLVISPPIPARPSTPLGVSRTAKKLSSEPVELPPVPPNTRRRTSQGSKTKVSNSSYSTTSYDIPIRISPSVQYDAKVSILENAKSQSCVPKLDPAPRPKTQKRGLPPRPVPPPGEKEPPEVAHQKAMYKLRVGTLPPPPKPPAMPVRSVSPTTYQLHDNFAQSASLDDRQAGCSSKGKEEETKNRFATTLSNFIDTHELEQHPKGTLADLWAPKKKKQQLLKQAISAPKPAVGPSSFSATAPPACPSKKHASISAGKQAPHSKGKAKEEFPWDKYQDPPRPAPPPPVPPLPPDYDAYASKLEKGKQKQPRHWYDLLTTSGTGVPFLRGAITEVDIPFSRKRADSDASMVCASSRQYENEQQFEQHQQKPCFGETMVFKGPVLQVPQSQSRVPAPPREVWRYSQENMLPEPLDVGSDGKKGKGREELRDTRFYRPVHSLLAEYRG
ncbi:hypothetical protein N0V90_003119 [Kalmusia sp. IMI 367209]|nr:hypothetical protein N0V90_003119 [Kalmusia sp. IMI 367209]